LHYLRGLKSSIGFLRCLEDELNLQPRCIGFLASLPPLQLEALQEY